MNTLIEHLNLWARQAEGFAWPMLWQSALLIAALWLLDLFLRRRARAVVRYALWLVVLGKLLLPPTLALPTGLAWWIPHHAPAAVTSQTPQFKVTYSDTVRTSLPPPELPDTQPAAPTPLTFQTWLLLAWAAGVAGLLGWMLRCWHQVKQHVAQAVAAPAGLAQLLAEAQSILGMRRRVQLRLTAQAMSPAVCGWFRPVILLPATLAERLAPEQLRAVLLHELIHVRRGDIWVNGLQTLLQIAYWWHPLVWLANAQLRRAREEAVDDAVMLALRDEADAYAPTLLEVAKLAFARPLASLGLVGILESRQALRQRIERLLQYHPPRRSGLTLSAVIGVLAFSALAVPMGEAPVQQPAAATTIASQKPPAENATPSPTPAEPLQNRTYLVDPHVGFAKLKQLADLPESSSLETQLKAVLNDAGMTHPPSYILFQETGGLMVRGTASQHALVEKVVQILNGYSSQTIPDLAAGQRHFQPSSETNAPATLSQGQARDVDAGSPAALFIRTFRVDPRGFTTSVRQHARLHSDSTPAEFIQAVRKILAEAGADFQTNGRSIYFENSKGILFARGSAQDLDTVEAVLQTLNIQPPQVNFRVRFIEIPEALPAGLLKTFATNGPSESWMGILTASAAKALQEQLEKQSGLDILAAPSVTTLSGRQAHIEVVNVQTIVQGIKPKALTSPGVTATNDDLAAVFETVQKPAGPQIDLITYVRPDGYAMELTAIPAITEFLGYDKPTNSVTVYVNGKPQTVAVPQPRYQVVQVANTCTITDGQTLVMGGLEVEEQTKIKDKTPVLGDIPALGRLFRNEATYTTKKQVLVLVTPTIIDAAGNRVHPDDLATATAVPPKK
ncbi:MAG TPA: M56 family metallopeptidase [Dongiaceae bacterium]|nr:M56 family metallopeptidase [Dongiaceae bacterium]